MLWSAAGPVSGTTEVNGARTPLPGRRVSARSEPDLLRPPAAGPAVAHAVGVFADHHRDQRKSERRDQRCEQIGHRINPLPGFPKPSLTEIGFGVTQSLESGTCPANPR